MSEQRYVPVQHTNELPPNSKKAVELDGRSILLCNSDGDIYAVDNICSHAEQPLECGRIRAGWIMCPAHGARFDLASGEPISGPAQEPIATFPVRITDGMIEIAV